MTAEPSVGAEVRARAALALERALESKAPLPGLLDGARVLTAPRDRGFLDELVLGTLRWLRRLDSVLEQAAGRPMASVDRDLHSPLRLAAYQLLFLDRVPSYAAVNAAVEAVKGRSHRGAVGFANAILRKIANRRDLAGWPVTVDDPIEALAIETSYPTFVVRRWVDRFGAPAARAALADGNRRPGFQLLCFGDRGELAAALGAEAVVVRPTPLAPLGLEVIAGDPRDTAPFRAGRLYIQDQASQAAALVPAPAAGEQVLDVAAAPGGKSFSLLAAEPRVRLVAADSSLVRLRRLRANQARLGIPFALAAARAEAPSFRDGFDRVIADLPCSGTGTFARHPELKWRVSESELARLSGQGLDMLRAAAGVVCAGGLLCAITCSLEREENEDVVHGLMAERPDFTLEALELPAAMAPFVAGPGLWRTLPAADHDGFTVHVLRRDAVVSARFDTAARASLAKRRRKTARRSSS